MCISKVKDIPTMPVIAKWKIDSSSVSGLTEAFHAEYIYIYVYIYIHISIYTSKGNSAKHLYMFLHVVYKYRYNV